MLNNNRLSKQEGNRFKLKNRYHNNDFYFISDFGFLKMITTYEAKSSRGIGEKEYG